MTTHLDDVQLRTAVWYHVKELQVIAQQLLKDTRPSVAVLGRVLDHVCNRLSELVDHLRQETR